MKKTIVVVKGTFNNIYFSGKGYRDLETLKNWNDAWENIKSFHWKYFKTSNTQYLVGVQGSIFLHPMDFKAVFHGCGCHTDDTFNCKDLQRICNEVAEKCGGTFDLEVSKPIEVDIDIVPYKDGIHNTL